MLGHNALLQLHPDTIQTVRKSIHMNAEDVKQAVNILRDWVKMQPHFKKKYFHDAYLESYLISSKGSIEDAKKHIDKMCTMRTLLPQFFEVNDVSKDFGDLFDIMKIAVLPKLTDEHHRVFIVKAYGNFTESLHFTNFYRCAHYIVEYIKRHDYINSLRIVQDLTAFDMIKFVSKLNPIELRQALSITTDCYGLKIKGIHFISPSKAVEALVTIVKQVLKPKIANRIFVHKTYEELHDIISKDVLPVEFGGKERSIWKIHDDWVKELSSEKHLQYMREMKEACTDEGLRPQEKFNEDYAGMPGTFRLLTVD
ncbi:unnamed protein product [Colias eurytheme]|nr:unnamed protein product [Colias eurytheme]